MTKTHHITHSEVFLRSRSRSLRATGHDAAEQLLVARAAAQNAFTALFDDIEDFDALVQECIPRLEEPAPMARRERGSADRSRFARGITPGRARAGVRVAEPSRPASTRR